MKKKRLAMYIAAVMAFSMFLTACTPVTDPTPAPGGQEQAQQNNQAQPGAQAEAMGTEPIDGQRIIRLVDTQDVSTLNAHDNVSIIVSDIYVYTHSGLFRRVPAPDGPGSIIVPDIAASAPIQIDEWTWQIPLRTDAVWHNGSPINAHTFEYSWKMLLDPLLINAMANFMFSGQIDIVNAQAYFQQAQEGNEPVDWEDVGIRVVDDYTLEIVTIQRWVVDDVMRHFLDRSLMPVYQPLYESGMNATRTMTTYGSSLDMYMGNGPFFFTEWMPDALRIFERNYDHWMSEWFNFDRVEVRVVADRNARIQMFENGEIDILLLDTAGFDMFRDDPRLRQSFGITPTHIDINVMNTDNPALANVNFRRALYWAMDRTTIARLAGGMIPSPFYVNFEAAVIIDGETVFFRDTPEGQANVRPNYGFDPERAVAYFELALEEIGQDFISVEIFYSDANVPTRVTGEFLQQALPDIFGHDRFELTLRAVPAAGFTEARNYVDNPTGHDMNFSAWGAAASRTRPHRAFQFNISSNPAPSRPNSLTIDEFDEIFAEADTEESRLDPQRHIELTAELERIFLDQVMQIPLWQLVTHTLYSERVTTVFDEWVPILGWGIMYADVVPE